MYLWITLCFVTATHGCATFYTDDNHAIPIGCVSGMYFFTPWDPIRVNTRFFIFDHAHSQEAEAVVRWNASLNPNDNLFRSDQRVAFIIHGYTENSGEPWIQKMKGLLLQKDPNTKVVLVDWSDGAYYNQTWYYLNRYFQASNNALTVGRVLACFIQRIMAAYHIPETSVTVIGHSIGAQIMGRTVAWLSEEFRIRIGTGIALEAASPLFSWKGLDPERTDVHFMLALHTASTTSLDKLYDGAVGVYNAYADLNLYPNNGTLIQPACRENNFYFCSHRRGYMYFMEMLSKCNDYCDFEGAICKSARDAVRGIVSNRTVNVCSFMAALKERQSDFDKPSTVITFDTDMDQLYIKCDYPENNKLS